MERIRDVIRARPLTVVGVLLGICVLAGAGIAGGSATRIDDLEAERAELEKHLDAARDLRVELDDDLRAARRDARTAEAQVRTAEEQVRTDEARAQEKAEADLADEQ